MKNQFCTSEISKAFKELRFNEPCLGYYIEDTGIEREKFSLASGSSPEQNTNSHNESIKGKTGLVIITAPLWQQAIDWLREKHKVVIYPEYADCNSLPIYVIKWHDLAHMEMRLMSRESAILKAIEIVKQGKK